MATPQDYQVDLQAAASQRINPFLKGLTMLTGGLAGEFTGTNEQIRSRNMARQVLLKEELDKRDEDRAIKRQLMANALQQRIQLDPNASIDQMIEKLRTEGIKGEVMASEGYTRGLGQFTGPSQYEADPRFQAAAQAGQLELAKRKAIAGVEEDIQRPGIASQLAGYGVKVDQGLPTGQLKSMLRQEEIRAQSAYPQAVRQGAEKDAVIELFNQNPELSAFKGLDENTIQNLAPGAYKGLGARANKELQTSVSKSTKLAQENAVVEATNILNGPPEGMDPKRLYQLSPYLPDYIIKSPMFQAATRTGPGPTPDELKVIKSYNDSLVGANRVSNLIAKVAETPGGLKKFSENNLGYISDQLNTKGSKFFANDSERELARALKAEYEAFVQEKRKTLFGASLTAGEQQSAASAWGSISDKDFFNRAVQFIDRLHEEDPIGFYISSGKSINPQLIERVSGLKKSYQEVRPKLGVGQFGAFTPAGGGTAPAGTNKNDRVQQLRDELNSLRSALTNAPSATR